MGTEKYVYSKFRLGIGAFMFFITFTIFVVISFFLYDWVSFKKDAAEVDAVITDIWYDISSSNEGSYRVKVTYIYNDNSYEALYPNYSSTMNVGQRLSVYVNKDDPTDIRPTTGVVLVIVDIVILIFAVASGIVFFGELAKGVYINRLIARDSYIYADYERQKITQLTVNDKRYFSTVFIYTDEAGEVRHFESSPYPLEKCPYEEGKGARVYVDLDVNPKKYHVSLSEHEEFFSEY